jgi:hypothetical protein
MVPDKRSLQIGGGMKVYISSTYRDLHKHRDAVATVLRRMGHQPIGMEDYVAEGARPLNRCLEDVRNCDAYVGVFAWRYGFVPTGPIQPMPTLAGTSVGSTSITEFEFRQAVESNKDVLMFLLDPDAEWPVSQIDPRPADGNPISRLRDECSQKYLVSHFRTPEELASLVSAAIYRVEIERQMRTSLRIESGLNQPYISAGQIGDSGLMVIRDVIATAQDAKALQINLGDGTAWWMTRLFLLSSLAVDLTDIEVIVFTDTDNTFLGTASSRTVGFGLGRAFPYLLEFDDQIVRSARCDNLSGEVDRRTSAWSALMAGRGGEEKTRLSSHAVSSGNGWVRNCSRQPWTFCPRTIRPCRSSGSWIGPGHSFLLWKRGSSSEWWINRHSPGTSLKCLSANWSPGLCR